MRTSVFALALLALGACKSPTPPVADADGDGSQPPADCDDNNAGIRPGAIDLWNDGTDANCDDDDRSIADFLEFPVNMRYGETGAARADNTRVCDLNSDGQDDLLLTLADEDSGTIYGFYGPLSAKTLTTLDADMKIDVAFALDQVACTDFDGDGNDDLLATEVFGFSGLVPADLFIFSQPAGGFDDETEADATTLTYLELLRFGFVDLTGNGRQDVIVVRDPNAAARASYLLPAGTYTSGDLLPEISALGDDFGIASALDDLDGDGTNEVMNCTETACTVLAPLVAGEGLVPLVELELPLSAEAGRYVSGDFDGDGDSDDLIGTSDVLGIGLVLDAGAALSAGTPIPQPSWTDTRDGLNFINNAGDVDGDGADDLMFWIDTPGGPDRRLFSGAELAAGSNKASATLLKVERDGVFTGGQPSGDLDGDGQPDAVFSGSYPDTEGFLGIYLSSEAL